MKRSFLIHCCVLAIIMMLATSLAFAQGEKDSPPSPSEPADVTDSDGIDKVVDEKDSPLLPPEPAGATNFDDIDKVAIDISSGTATITGPTTITLNNVSAMGGCPGKKLKAWIFTKKLAFTNQKTAKI